MILFLVVSKLVLILHHLKLTKSTDNYFVKSYDDCDYWAKVDNECLNNPLFMWSKCTSSCYDYSTDDDDIRCPSWAKEGECTANPGYIQIHCPRSCKLSILWSPWVRSKLGMIMYYYLIYLL